MELDLNISPCPNDTFMFDALVNGRIDTEGLKFRVSFKDIEELNSGVVDGNPVISKISYAVVPQIYGRYTVVNSGSALGRGNGPLLVGKTQDAEMHGIGTCGMKDIKESSARWERIRTAVPGMNTTARLLMNKFYPELTSITPVLFSEIADRIVSGEFDAGVLIHEGRFTYAEKGLRLICDLGERWEQETGMPLPLGAIVVSRSLPGDTVRTFDRLLRRSIVYAMRNPQASEGFVREHAQEMSPDVIKSHIRLFVNEYSLDIGDEGKKAVSELTGIGASGIFL